MLHQVGDLFELNVKLRCQKVNIGFTFILRMTKTSEPPEDGTEPLSRNVYNKPPNEPAHHP